MTNEELVKHLLGRRTKACDEAINWLGKRNSDEMWAECEKPDWLLWYAAANVSRKELVLAACDCAETALRYVPEGEDRPRLAIETARSWASGDADIQSVKAAVSATGKARNADSAAAADAAYAAGYAAAACYSTYSPYSPYSPDAGEEANLCDLIRKRWPVCPCTERVNA